MTLVENIGWAEYKLLHFEESEIEACKECHHPTNIGLGEIRSLELYLHETIMHALRSDLRYLC